MSKKKLIKNTLIYALGDICPKLFSLIIFPIYTTHLPPSEYGIVNYINTLNTFLSVVCVLSLHTCFMVLYYKCKSSEERKCLFGNLSLAVIAFTTLISAFLFLLGPMMFSRWGSNVPFFPFISLGVFINICDVVTFLPSSLYRVQERPLPLTILNVAKSLLIMLGSALAVTVFCGSAYEVLVSRLIISSVFSIVFLFSTKNYFSFSFDFELIKKSIRFAVPLVPGALAYYLFSLFDRILIDKYLSLSHLGIYSTASTIALMLGIVSHSAYKAFEPYFFQEYGNFGFEVKFEKVRNLYLLAIIFCALGLGAFSKEFLKVFSNEAYHCAYIYIPALLMGSIFSALSLLYSTIIIARGKTIQNTITTSLGATLSIFLNVLYLEKYEIWASSFSFAMSFGVVLLLNMIISNIKVSHYRSVIALLIGLSGIWGLTFFDSGLSFLWGLVIKAFVILATSFICALILKVNVIKILKGIIPTKAND